MFTLLVNFKVAVEYSRDLLLWVHFHIFFFGDYQILYDLKSNCVFKTLEENSDDDMSLVPDDTIFMCCAKDRLLELCDMFPETAENIKATSLLRRKRIIK